MTYRFQFSLRTVLLLLTALAISLALIVQVPHIFILIVSGACALAASLVAYQVAKNFRLRMGAVVASSFMLVAFTASWILFYILSLGPFISLSELDKKITGRHHLGRLAGVYCPAMQFNNLGLFRWHASHLLRWYFSQWIPEDAAGLPALYPTKISPNLVGTWQTGGTQVVNLRADGTGRAYGSLTTSDLIYCEWASDASEFAIYQYASKLSASAWMGCIVMNSAPTDRFEVVESSATHFKLRDKTGTIISLTRSPDNKLELAP